MQAKVVGGPPLLRQAALERAEKSLFQCNGCNDTVTSYGLVYSFQLGPTSYCVSGVIAATNDPGPVFPRVSQSENHVTLVDQPVGTCDFSSDVRARSLKCLYLWKCAFR